MASPADWEHIGNSEWGLPDWGIGEEWGREACLWACGAAPARWGRGWRHGGVAARVRANESSTQAGDGRGPRTTPRRVSAWMWMGRRPAHTATGHHLNSHRPTAPGPKNVLCFSSSSSSSRNACSSSCRGASPPHTKKERRRPPLDWGLAGARSWRKEGTRGTTPRLGGAYVPPCHSGRSTSVYNSVWHCMRRSLRCLRCSNVPVI